VLRDPTSRGLSVRVWPPHTSERRGGGGGHRVVSKKVGKEVTVRGAQGLCMSNYQTVWFCGLSNLPRTRISTVRVCQGPGEALAMR